MKKYFLTMVVMAVFAIGFAASDDTSSSSSSSSHSSSKPEQKEEHEFFEPGHTYISNEMRVAFSIYEQYHKYEMTLYKDGSMDLKEITRFPNHETEDKTWVCDNCKMRGFYESKRDIARRGYNISGEHRIDGRTYCVDFGVDYEGHIWEGGVSWETMGKPHDGYFIKK